MNNLSLGLLILRVFAGLRIIYGVIDNILDWDKMLEFASFLEKFHFPIPLLSAILSVGIQLFGGFLILIGWQTRWASIFLAINFFIAILMVHLPNKDSIELMTPAFAMLSISLCLCFTGAGKHSVDKM